VKGGTVDADANRLVDWLAARFPWLAPPLSVELVASGRSNLTYRVAGRAGASVVVRRPPTGSVAATAHDMQREWRFLTALAPTDVPVPTPLAFGADPALFGAPFYVMSHVAGTVLDEPAAGAELAWTARTRVGAELVDVLVRLHELDPAAVGLADLVRAEGLVERQLRRWRRQIERSTVGHRALLDEVHGMLAARVPAQTTRIVHGDYRPGNAMFDSDGRVRAILDWELATTGDPLADLGWLVSTWQEPGDPTPPTTGGPSTVAGYGGRDALVARYVARSGRDVSDLPFYVAFSRWRAACILAGVADRYRAGVMGGDVLPPAVAERVATGAALAEAARADLRA
jgi:aminoglycoside phosphotransferase (APT) family kinase protein